MNAGDPANFPLPHVRGPATRCGGDESILRSSTGDCAAETSPPPAKLDSANHWMVCAGRDGMLAIRRAPIGWLRRDMVLNLAAWLAVLADPEGKEFDRLREEIKKS